MAFGQPANDGRLKIQSRLNFKNAESKGDYDIDRRPHAKQFVKKSTINLLAEADNEQPYFMKNIQEKSKRGPQSSLDIYGPVSSSALTDRVHQVRSRNDAQHEIADI